MKKSFEIVDDTFESSKNALYSYITGFSLSLFLTIIPYVMVTEQMFSRGSLMVGIVLFAGMQLCVQVYFFLHLPVKQKPYWNMIIFFYTILILVILVIGSLWIMHNLNVNMMGVSPFHSNEGYIPQ